MIHNCIMPYLQFHSVMYDAIIINSNYTVLYYMIQMIKYDILCYGMTRNCIISYDAKCIMPYLQFHNEMYDTIIINTKLYSIDHMIKYDVMVSVIIVYFIMG